MRNPSRTRAVLAAFAAFGALIGTLVAMSGAGDAPVAAAVHGAMFGSAAGATTCVALVALLLADGDRILRR